MALENQPFFRAPEVPKMGKKTVSSSIFSNAGKNLQKPSLRTSRFSFTKPKEVAQPEVLTQKIIQPKQENVASALIETNRILVEIQKQLSLDFANRIAESKQSLALSKRSILKQKAVKKESFIERGGGLAKTLANQFKSVVAPAKSIFDKLLEFVTILGTGILINNAWKWLSDEKNRENLVKVLKFLADNWKWLVGIWIGGKLLRPIRLLISAISGLRRVINFLRGKRRPPDTGPKGGKPGGGTPGSGGGGNFCQQVYDCIKDKVADFVKIFTPYFAPVGTPTTPPVGRPVRPQIPISPIYQPSPTQPIKEPEKPKTGPTGSPLGPITLPNPFGLPDWANYTAYGLAGTGLIAGGIALAPALGIGGGGSAAVGGGATSAGGATALSRVLTGAGRISKTAPPGGTTLSRSEMAKKLVGDKKLNVLRGQELASQISKRASELVKITGRNKSNLREIYNNPNSPLLDKMAARELLEKLGENLPKLIPFSSGGTVGGRGSGSIDSVPAMLAPGEEVIRTASANLFRPLLKDINDNAGRMFQSFEEGVRKQQINNIEQEQTATRFNTLLTDFTKQLEEIKRKEEDKKLEDLLNKIGGGSKSPSLYLDEIKKTKEYEQSVKPKAPNVNFSTSLKVEKKETPVVIQDYPTRKKSGASTPTVINMPMPPIDLSKNQSAPMMQSSDSSEDSSPEISIEAYDVGNPYIYEAFENYGIFA